MKGPTIPKEKAEEAVNTIITDLTAQEKGQKGSRIQILNIGKLEKEVKDFLSSRKIDILSDDIILTGKQLLHCLREVKAERGIAVTPEKIYDFIRDMKSYSIRFDKEKRNLIYYKKEDDIIVKFVVELNYNLKGRIVNPYITAGKVFNTKSFLNNSIYIDIKKAEQ